ncbi:MAG: hypothetical protein M1818_008165 [Claussenomyces sp. TS43310]|nr:MAG: hypothetical protein M1818_008165 [Claussenomyces sp. TS43310]
MPSFSLLPKRFKRTKDGKGASPDRQSTAVTVASEANEKVQRRQSRRDFFRSLIVGSKSRPDSRLNRRDDHLKASPPQGSGAASPNRPASQMPNANKPLPPPPPSAPEPGTSKEDAQRKNSVVKLNRIISPLHLPEVQKLFSGAPHFFVRSEGQHLGAPWPSVAFPWNVELEIRDLSDHGQIEDQAWSSVTVAQHIVRDLDKKTAHGGRESRRAHYRPRCFERPNMLSAQGLERGTIGYSAALQLSVADALQEDSAGDFSRALVERRNSFLRDRKRGIRTLDESAIAAKLIEIAELYTENILLHKRTSVELYTDLFTQVLYPPTRVTDSDDPYSLQVQIEELLDVLGAPSVWIDFSLVEWRIRLGQILWEDSNEPDAEDDVSIDGETGQESGTQRQWLLLQILLSCELLIRLDAITQIASRDSNTIKPQEIQHFDTVATTRVRWSLILARRWLDNVEIESTKTASPKEKPVGGWLASLTRKAPAPSSMSNLPATNELGFHGKHQTRQFSGLVHFARRLDWPRLDIIAGKVSQGLLKSDNASVTSSTGTPLSITRKRSSYFDSKLRRPASYRALSRQHRISAIVHPSGWLSRSYLSGLVLPGESLSHLLISTLLENDETAIRDLGDEANLYGGFVYSAKSFWSTACVIGRVLAAGRGASECMGWLSTDVVPRGVSDSWVNIEVDPAPQDVDSTPGTARIWKKETVERESHVLGDGDPSSILPGDFTLPAPDAKDVDTLSVKLESLDLFASDDSQHSTTPTTPMEEQLTPPTEVIKRQAIKTYSAMMRFSVSAKGHESREFNVALTYDVHFVTAHPCVPSQNNSILAAPGGPTIPSVAQDKSPSGTSSGPHELYLGKLSSWQY